MTHIYKIALIALLALPATAGQPVHLYLDGQLIGTLKALNYQIAQGEIHITTHQIIRGCEQDQVFWDRFE